MDACKGGLNACFRYFVKESAVKSTACLRYCVKKGEEAGETKFNLRFRYCVKGRVGERVNRTPQILCERE